MRSGLTTDEHTYRYDQSQMPKAPLLARSGTAPVKASYRRNRALIRRTCASGSGARRCSGSRPGPVPRVSATSPNPVWRPRPPSLWPLFLQPCTRASREPRRSLPVAPLIGDKRCYGEATVRAWGAPVRRAGSGRSVTHPTETAKNQKLHHKCLNRRNLSPLPRTATGPPPGRPQTAPRASGENGR